MFKSRLSQPGEPVREPKVFICYRHLDSKAHVGRLRDRLHTTLGPDAAFLDKDDLPPGGDFPEEIAETIKTCDALLVVIGPDWLDEGNRRRLHEPGDFVRQEIAAALHSEGVKVIPVLVGGGEMPRADELPEEIKPLTRRTAIKLSDDHWDYDTQRLLDALRGLVPHEHPPPSGKLLRAGRPSVRTLARKPLFVAALVAVVAALLALAAFKYLQRPAGLGDCLADRARESGISPERVKTLERGAFDYTVVEADQPKGGRLLLRFSDSGRDLGAAQLSYDAATGRFKVEQVVGPDCATDYSHYGNEDRPGLTDILYNWDRFLVRFREGGEIFRLRIGDHPGGVRASFDVARDPTFAP